MINEDNKVAESQVTRRRFLKSTSVGAIIASIPGKSVWASGTVSLVSNGSVNGSGPSDGEQEPVQLGSGGYWKHHYSPYKNMRFSSVFGGRPIVGHYDTHSKDPTLQKVLEKPGTGHKKYGGPSNVNYHMVAMYLNAAHSGEYDCIYYPIIEQGTFSSLNAFASYMYSSAESDPYGFGSELSSLISQYDKC